MAIYTTHLLDIVARDSFNRSSPDSDIKVVEFLIALTNNQGTPKRIISRVSKIGKGGGWWGRGRETLELST